MSVTVTKADGVTVFTLISDPKSSWPPLCQILKSLCYSPACCSVSQQLKRVQASQAVLATLHILVGLFNISLGIILVASPSGAWWQMYEIHFPYWLGGLFILFGIMCIVSEKYPSPCAVTLTVILNLAGVAFAITAIVLYSCNLANTDVWWSCNGESDYYDLVTLASPSRQEEQVRMRCMEGKEVILMLIRSINAVLIVLSVLELCVTISSAVMGIKSLRSSWKEPNESAEEPETYKPLLEEVTTQPAA